MRRLSLALCAGLLFFAACGGDDGAAGGSDEADDTTTTVATSNAAGTTTATSSPTTSATASSPTTQPAATAPPTNQAVAKTTAASTTLASTTTKPKPTTTAPLVTFAQFSVVGPACPAPDVSIPTNPQVTVKWKLAGVIPDDVYVAVDNKDGPYESGLATQGEFVLGYPCDGNQHTYYVVAVVGAQQFYKSKKV